jgi:LysR family glycine cleavage system transcriptional activator
MTDWNTLPPLSALRAFCAYADKGSVQAAGDALNVSHAAISQQIRNLESHMGLTLLDRTGRSAKLTAQGRQLAKALDSGFGEISASVAALTGADEARALHVTTTPSFASEWLMPRLPDFRQQHPEFDIVIDANSDLSDPTPGGVDVGLRFGYGDWPGVESECLLATTLAVVAAPDLIGDCPSECPEDLLLFPWIQAIGTSETSKWFLANGVTDTRTAGLISLPGNHMIEAARAGQGIAVTALEWVRDDLETGRLKLLFESGDGKGYYIVTAPGVARPALRKFLAWLRRQASCDNKS